MPVRVRQESTSVEEIRSKLDALTRARYGQTVEEFLGAWRRGELDLVGDPVVSHLAILARLINDPSEGEADRS